ncbi:MAG: glycine cleavage system aminomethyltransferase GcvT, partial [Pseudomonadota bacterium]
MADLKTVHLNDLHVELGAKMVPFAGYSMPVQYAPGVLKEHLHTRSKAGLFDVSHMGQVLVEGPDAALALEAIIPINILGLKEGRQRYGFLTNDEGGLIDDLMVANQGDRIFIVINASRTLEDMAHINALLPSDVTATLLTDRALLALQGPAAETVLATFNP